MSADCAEWLDAEPREPQENCPCGHYAASHALGVCLRCGAGFADEANS